MKIAIIGANGQLGSDLCKLIDKSDLIPLTIKDIDITNEVPCKELLLKLRPDIVINTAGYSRVDACESNDSDAYKVNAHGAKNLAIICKEIDAKLVHISTDYVFDGDKGSPYTESDTPNPKTAYGISKLAGELFIRYLAPKYFIIRSSGLFGTAGCMDKGGGNFVDNMIKKAKAGDEIRVVSDEIISPTYTFDLAKAIINLIKTDNYGIYHITNHGQCSWWEYTSKIFELLGMDVKIGKILSAELRAKAHRPKYSVLDNNNLKAIGLDNMPSWKEALKAYLIEKGHII